MKQIILLWGYISVLIYCKASLIDASYDYPDPHAPEETTTPANTINTINCTKMKFHCESCTNLVMCINTEYGFTKQYVTCPAYTTCLRDHCTVEKNPLCDGTADIPFECHVPGMFPDPFDCKKYHFCVPKSGKVVNENGTLELMHFEHSCQEDAGVEYRYDPNSRYCKLKIENGCEDWPVPLCVYEAQTDALNENKSIFFVCDMVNGHLYPHLYACPHGEEYDKTTTKCEKRSMKIFDHDIGYATPIAYRNLIEEEEHTPPPLYFGRK